MVEQPDHECPLCPRLLAYRNDNRARFPEWHNGPVVSFGNLDSCLLIVGLAPGLKGANRTGRPFTGDVAGDLLYPTLIKFGLAGGTFGAEADDGLKLRDCRITNAVRCAPPQNKVTGPEIAACRPYLSAEIANMKKLKVILALGVVAHGAVLSCLGEKKKAIPFAHAARHKLTGGLTLMDSYHCSRYNTNTGRLTTEMFEGVFNNLVGEIRGDCLS
ncbi:MAG: uracil-DNA glycosylase [Rhodospirillaceae bacterium]|nr:uracil-DNA glycosylase [Rhodospirillaceae bacterium]MBL6941828.1 uracil-DNA glycosylase [Rhodospirillales bacterium]